MSNIEPEIKAEAVKAETGLVALIEAHPKTALSVVAGLALIALLAIVL
jgi:hypothetical protein